LIRRTNSVISSFKSGTWISFIWTKNLSLELHLKFTVRIAVNNGNLQTTEVSSVRETRTVVSSELTLSNFVKTDSTPRSVRDPLKA
jgi:hypothetical protein